MIKRAAPPDYAKRQQYNMPFWEVPQLHSASEVAVTDYS
jgi:hypothetical protein